MSAEFLAEYASPEELIRAAERVGREGGSVVEVYSPYPLHACDSLFPADRNLLPVLMFGAGALGAAVAYIALWWMTAIDYPLRVGGFSLHPAPAFVPITFEACVLAAGVFGFLAFFALCRLPKFGHPIFQIEGFERASIDRFFLHVRITDSSWLQKTGALRIVPMRRVL
jgi:hypothetical protein